MKVILREEIESLGNRGDVVNVREGYARNYLLPKGLVMRFTEGAHKVLEQERRVYEKRQAEEVKDAEALAASLNGVAVTIAKRVADSTTLYGSVTNLDLADALAAQNLKVDRRLIHLDKPIKALGDYEVRIRLHGKVSATVKLSVVPAE